MTPVLTDFDEWVSRAHRQSGDFTMLFVLLGITDTTAEPLRWAWLHVVGDETRWPDMVQVFAGAGVAWSGAVFFRAGREGLVHDAEARARVGALARKMHEDRTLIRDGEFFNADGLRLRLDERTPH